MNRKSSIWYIIIIPLLLCLCINACYKRPYATDLDVTVWEFGNPMGVVGPDAQGPAPQPPIEYHLVCLTFDLAKDIDTDEFQKWADSVVQDIRDVQGCYKCRPYTNTMLPYAVKWASWWPKFEDCNTFMNSNDWHSILTDLHAKYANNINIEIWQLDYGISLLPEPNDEDPVKPQPYVAATFQMNLTFNLSDNVKPSSYYNWANRVITKIIQARGCVGWCSSHNKLDTPMVEWTSWWNNMDDWAKFVVTDDWQQILSELSEPH